MVWNSKDWAEKSEAENKDSRNINFVLAHEEYFKNYKKDGLSSSNQVTPRMLDKFFSVISTLESYSDNIPFISQVGAASIKEDLTKKFIKFIGEKLDKLPTPSKLLKELEEKDCLAALTRACGNYKEDPKSFNAASAAILAIRLANYMLVNPIDSKMVNQFIAIINHTSFTEDQKYMMVRKVSDKKGSTLFSKLVGNPKISKYLVA